MDERMTFVLSGQYSSLFTYTKAYSVMVLFFNLRPYVSFCSNMLLCGWGGIACELMHFLNNRCEFVSNKRTFGLLMIAIVRLMEY